jgi:hypothetical protein
MIIFGWRFGVDGSGIIFNTLPIPFEISGPLLTIECLHGFILLPILFLTACASVLSILSFCPPYQLSLRNKHLKHIHYLMEECRMP